MKRTWETISGAGDLVAIIAKPIAIGIDKIAKTDLKHCKACDRRKAKLNKAIPF